MEQCGGTRGSGNVSQVLMSQVLKTFFQMRFYQYFNDRKSGAQECSNP